MTSLTQLSRPFVEKQDLYKGWINDWKICNFSELADCFHLDRDRTSLISSDNTSEGKYLVRVGSYHLAADVWGDILREMKAHRLNSIRIHLSIGQIPEFKSTPILIPLIQAINKELIASSGGEEGSGMLYPFTPEFPITEEIAPRAIIPPEMVSSLIGNWSKLAISAVVDQFESKENSTLERVRHYTFEQNDVVLMPDSEEKISEVYFYPGINHNFDSEGRPSFAPVLEFQYHNSTVRGNDPKNPSCFEFATPCPPTC